MKRTIFLILALLCTTLCVFAAEHIFRGRVVDSTTSCSVGGGYRFPKGKWFNNARLSASYSASPTATMAQTVDFGYYHNLGVSFSAYIPKIKAGFDIKVGDILHGHNYVENTIRSGTFVRHNANERLGRSVSVSAYIRFGKFKRVIGEIEAPKDIKTF